MTEPDHACEVLVVGGGPSGAAAAYWLAKRGHSVTIVEKNKFPRDKTCGDALSPRGVKQLVDMGLSGTLTAFHQVNGLRLVASGRELELPWPSHAIYPDHGFVVRRNELDGIVAANAVAAGATLIQGCEALTPIVERGFVRGAMVQPEGGEPYELHAKYVVVADGADSRFGRSLGTFRTRDWPFGTAIRAYWESPRHNEVLIESVLDVKDRKGNVLPGYGWIFPVGDGTVNVGVGLLSTFRDFKSVNPAHLLESHAQSIAERWQISPDQALCDAASGRIPMGGSIGPIAGPTYLVVGDAAGSVNPFNGEGIDYAYETARMAADVLHEALSSHDASVLQRYPRLLDDEFGQYFKMARLFARIIGRPALMRELTRAGMHNRSLMEWALRIMSNLLRPDEMGPAEIAYKAIDKIVRLAPNA